MTALIDSIGGIFTRCGFELPVEVVFMRASEIPSVVKDERSIIKAGLTGSDILWEAGWGKDAGIEIPVYTDDEKYPWNIERYQERPNLYFGMTWDFVEKIQDQKGRDPEVTDLSGYMLATKLPNIARGYLAENGVWDASILKVGGTDEAMQYAYPDCYGTLGVIKTGRTAKQNGIAILDTFYPVSVRWIEFASKTNEGEKRILRDLLDRLLRGRTYLDYMKEQYGIDWSEKV